MGRDYDADPNDPFAKKYRLPIVESIRPEWYYLVAICAGGDLYGGLRPTDREAAMIASFRDEYIDRWYKPSYVAKMARYPFDVDGGANGTTFLKRAEGSWAYRRRTWEYGPALLPSLQDGQKVLDLPDLLDVISAHGEDGPSKRWAEWKAAHREVFA